MAINVFIAAGRIKKFNAVFPFNIFSTIISRQSCTGGSIEIKAKKNSMYLVAGVFGFFGNGGAVWFFQNPGKEIQAAEK
ncbi:hypothetical protein MASR1M12_43980 [Erysipelotrichia bacterium]